MSPRRRVHTALLVIAAVGFLALVASVLLAASLLSSPLWKPDYPVLTPPLPYYSAVEAIKVASPQVRSWNPDAIIVAMHTGPMADPFVPAIRNDGRSTSWTVMVASPSAALVSYITLVDDVTYVSGHDGQPAEPLRFDPVPLPADEMLDSDDALSTALASGAPGLPVSISTRLPYTDSNQNVHPLSWVLGYGERGNDQQIVIHALTGELLENDFGPLEFLVRPNNSMEPTRPARSRFLRDTSLGWPGGSSRGR